MGESEGEGEGEGEGGGEGHPAPPARHRHAESQLGEWVGVSGCVSFSGISGKLVDEYD